MTDIRTASLGHLVPAPATLRFVAILLAVETGLVAAYLAVSETQVLSLRLLSYPFVWVNGGLLAVRAVDVPAVRDRRTAGAAIVALGYFALVAWTTGLVGLGTGGPLGVRAVAAIPGWGPVVLVRGPLTMALVPFEVVGYACLAVLVYAGVARATAGVLSGLLGVVTCVSCTGPVLAGVATGLVGGASTAAVGAATGAFAYDVSTLLFVVTLAALRVGLR
jgi:hypothetical protein